MSTSNLGSAVLKRFAHSIQTDQSRITKLEEITDSTYLLHTAMIARSGGMITPARPVNVCRLSSLGLLLVDDVIQLIEPGTVYLQTMAA